MRTLPDRAPFMTPCAGSQHEDLRQYGARRESSIGDTPVVATGNVCVCKTAAGSTRTGRPDWRNGRRSGLKNRGPKGHPSSNLGSGTTQFGFRACRWCASTREIWFAPDTGSMARLCGRARRFRVGPVFAPTSLFTHRAKCSKAELRAPHQESRNPATAHDLPFDAASYTPVAKVNTANTFPVLV